MYRYRKKRVYHILGVLAFAGGMFLVFQLFSMEILSFHARREENRVKNSFLAQKELGAKESLRPHLIDSKMKKDVGEKNHASDCVEGKCDNAVKESAANNEKKNGEDKVRKYVVGKYKQHMGKTNMPNQMDTKNNSQMSQFERLDARCTSSTLQIGETENMWHVLENCFADYPVSEKNLPLGVFSGWAHLYKPDKNGMFTCIKSKEKMPMNNINDDFCDCSDGSDEPGTSACDGARFYCTFQLSRGALQWLPTSRVDDMICDCCDGSDEPRKFQLPNHVKLDKDKQYYGIHQAPCSNRCQELKMRQQALEEIRIKGLTIKQTYIQAAIGQDNANNKYGSDGAFYKLSQSCFMANSDKYVYEVCPFKQVKQTWSTLPFKVIGRDGDWISSGRAGWTLKMGNGESNQCPGMRGRISFIKFECGLDDVVLAVAETEVCEYTVHFSTPAAC